ncbi:MAG: DUF2975 domain-containing protein [Clostridiaceae bacterium]|jgi:hypothetical protein|nr:DUF2975 domain-containing protein [Oscillospiraceae bacterium]NLO61819.1 DUF2975 domain-containing protein [Clostridiaceae bacterium]
MERIGNKSLSFALRLFTDFLLLLNLAALIGLPWIVKYMVDYLTVGYGWSEPYVFLLAFFYFCGVFTLGILLQGHLILRTLEMNQPFDVRNSRRLFRVGLFCALIAAAFLVKVLLYNTILTSVGAGIFLLVSLIAFILADVFAKASRIWEDQQLTV